MSLDYKAFLEAKTERFMGVGFEPQGLNRHLMPFQKDIAHWACMKGRAAIFSDCGTGKSLMQLAWADAVAEHTDGDILILAPLSVSQQTVQEAGKFGIEAKYSRNGKPASRITVANFEMMEHFSPSDYVAVVLDESSILKASDGKTRSQIIEAFRDTEYRLACTATPAPNDFMELGNHSEFLGIMKQTEMLSKFFFHDGGETQAWTLKGHAEDEFWKWVCSWAVMLRKPSDIGHDDVGFILPELRTHQHSISVPTSAVTHDLFGDIVIASTLNDQRDARRESLNARVSKCASLVNGNSDAWLVWCDLNAEGDALEKALDGAVQVSGSDSLDSKVEKIQMFLDGRARVLVTKPKVAGMGLNLQHCHKEAFVGVSHSFEAMYQAIRRCWRFGQKHPVDVHLICSEREGPVLENLMRKEADAAVMVEGMLRHVSIHSDIAKSIREHDVYTPQVEAIFPDWLRSKDEQ